MGAVWERQYDFAVASVRGRATPAITGRSQGSPHPRHISQRLQCRWPRVHDAQILQSIGHTTLRPCARMTKRSIARACCPPRARTRAGHATPRAVQSTRTRRATKRTARAEHTAEPTPRASRRPTARTEADAANRTPPGAGNAVKAVITPTCGHVSWRQRPRGPRRARGIPRWNRTVWELRKTLGAPTGRRVGWGQRPRRSWRRWHAYRTGGGCATRSGRQPQTGTDIGRGRRRCL